MNTLLPISLIRSLLPHSCTHRNRAARIGSVAKSGQVWMSEHAWEEAQDEINQRDRPSAGEGDRTGGPPFAFEQEREVTALTLGGFKLKGIVVSCLDRLALCGKGGVRLSERL